MTNYDTFPVHNIDPRYAMQDMKSIQASVNALKAKTQKAAAAGAEDTDSSSSTASERDAQSSKVDKLLGEFQSIMFGEMVKAMRATVPKSELFGKSMGEETFQSFLDEQYSSAMSQKMGGLGLTEALKRQLGLEDDKTLTPEAIAKKNKTDATQAARLQSAILTEKE